MISNNAEAEDYGLPGLFSFTLEAIGQLCVMQGTWFFQEMKITVTVFAVDIFNYTIIPIH